MVDYHPRKDILPMLKPVVRTDLVVSPRPNGEGVLVYDPTNDTGHVLVGVTAAVFAACNGTADIAVIEARVAEATGAIADPAAVDAAIDQLSAAGLLDEPKGISRRVLIGGLIAGAAAVAIAPVITSVARPRKASAQAASSVDPKTATTPADTSVQIPLSSVGFDATRTVYWNVDQPAYGTVTVTNTSSGGMNTGAYATYTPNPGYSGPDSFSYVAGQCSSPGVYTYIAPTAAQDSCPAGSFIGGTYIGAALVSITVTPTPTTTTTTTPATTTTLPTDESTPKYTG
jgi:Bacterial Ig domain